MSVMAINSYACAVCEKINNALKRTLLTLQQGRQHRANIEIARLMHRNGDYRYDTEDMLLYTLDKKTREEYDAKRNEISD